MRWIWTSRELRLVTSAATAFGGEAVQFGKEQAPGGKTRRAGVEGRKARGKEVGVNEIPDVLLR